MNKSCRIIDDKDNIIKEKEWCIYSLLESEIWHIAEKVFDSGYTKGLITDNELEEIVDDFKDAVMVMCEDYEIVLEEIIRKHTLDKDKVMIKTFEENVKNDRKVD